MLTPPDPHFDGSTKRYPLHQLKPSRLHILGPAQWPPWGEKGPPPCSNCGCTCYFTMMGPKGYTAHYCWWCLSWIGSSVEHIWARFDRTWPGAVALVRGDL